MMMMNGWVYLDPAHIERVQAEMRLRAAQERTARQVDLARRGRERLRHRVGAHLVVLGYRLAGPAEPCCAECA